MIFKSDCLVTPIFECQNDSSFLGTAEHFFPAVMVCDCSGQGSLIPFCLELL